MAYAWSQKGVGVSLLLSTWGAIFFLDESFFVLGSYKSYLKIVVHPFHQTALVYNVCTIYANQLNTFLLVWLGDETNSTFWAILFLKLVCFVAACCAH